MHIVTGGAGFIGSNLVRKLIASGRDDVVVVDDLGDGHKFVNIADVAIADYLDKEGKPMTEGGGSLVIEGDENWAGAGHCSAYTFSGKDYLVFHAYDVSDNGRSKLKIAEMTWDEEGWPVIDKSVLQK